MIKSLLTKVRKVFKTATAEVVMVSTQVEQKIEEFRPEVNVVVEEIKNEVQPIIETVVKSPIQKLKKSKTEKKPRKPKNTKV